MIGHTIELVNEISCMISRIIEHAPSYRLCNLAIDKVDNSAHILVLTLGQILACFSGSSNNLDLSELRVFVLDKADYFFQDKNCYEEIHGF